jgi:hypothetical protein
MRHNFNCQIVKVKLNSVQPNDIRKLINIFCTDQLCQNNKCMCMKEGLKCCSDCSCKKCHNNVSCLGMYENEDDEESI